MTRINSHIPVEALCDQHLLAEHREIIRIPNVIKNGKAVIKNIPKKFVLGTGHVKFFYDKLGYLQNRYVELHLECKNRGFDVQDFSECFLNCPPNLCGDFPKEDYVVDLLVERISERLDGMKSIKYKRASTTAEDAKQILFEKSYPGIF